jgi:hypothetical protein
MPRVLRRAMIALALGATLLGLHNVFGDSEKLEYQGRVQACADRGPNCVAALTRMVRTPFFQDLHFRTSEGPVHVRCARSLYLLGPHVCSLRPGP